MNNFVTHNLNVQFLSKHLKKSLDVRYWYRVKMVHLKTELFYEKDDATVKVGFKVLLKWNDLVKW